MRVYFILESLGGRGGVEIALTAVMKLFQERGHETLALLPERSLDPTWEQELGGVYYYHPSQRQGLSETEFIGDRVIALTETLAELPDRPDLVVATHVPMTTLYARLALGNERIPLVSWLHNPPSLFRNYHYINYADVHWCISRGIEKFLQEHMHNNRHVNWVGNPFSLQVERVTRSQQPRFVYMGRIENRQKRLDLLLLAFQFSQPDWILDIYGSGNQEELNLLKQLAEALQIVDRVVWHGWVDNPWAKIREATALVLTSDYEGLPMVIGEAFARGLPVIATDCPTGPADYIDHGVNGWLVPTGDQQSLADALKKVAELTVDEWEQIAEAAVSSMAHYSGTAVYERMMDTVAAFMSEGGDDSNDH